MLTSHTNLIDAYIEANGKVNLELEGATCYSKTNYYNRKPTTIKSVYPHGIRIDFVLYKSNELTEMKCVESRVCFSKIPNSPLNFSDHEGVAAEFQIKKKNVEIQLKDENNLENEEEKEDVLDSYEKVKYIVTKCKRSFRKYQVIFTLVALACLPLMLLVSLNDTYLNTFKDFAFSLVFCFAICYNLVRSYEKKHLENTLHGLDVIINNHKLKKNV